MSDSYMLALDAATQEIEVAQARLAAARRNMLFRLIDIVRVLVPDVSKLQFHVLVDRNNDHYVSFTGIVTDGGGDPLPAKWALSAGAYPQIEDIVERVMLETGIHDEKIARQFLTEDGDALVVKVR